jgi:Na+-driven multidrug efflux pump
LVIDLDMGVKGASAVFQPLKVSNMTLFGILASGGDTKFLLISDLITVFLVGLPLAYVLAFNLGLGFWGVFLGRLLGEETVRIGMFLWRYCGVNGSNSRHRLQWSNR